MDQAFEILHKNKITTNKESVRRWLRTGVIKGIAPASRKDGWKITESDLQVFIQQRLPESYTTNVAKKDNETNVVNDRLKDQIRAEMWRECTKKNIWEGYIELKKSFIRECIKHRRYSKDLEEKVWAACIANSLAYSKPRISYLLEAFSFDGKRLLMDKNFESLEEQIVFPMIEYVRNKNKRGEDEE